MTRRARPRSRLIGAGLLLAAAGAIVSSVAATFATTDYRLDLIAQFTGPAVFATSVAAIVAAAALRPKLAAVLLVALAAQLWAMQPQLTPIAPASEAGARPVRVYFANLYYLNPRPELAAGSIAAEQPDVIALIEVGPRHLRALDRTLAAYPHRLNAVTGVYQGRSPRIMIASRYPLRRLASERRDRLAVTEAEVAAPSGGFRLIVTHLTRPWPFDDPQAQTRQASRLARRVLAGDPERTLVVGDFNAVAAGRVMSRFSRETGLTPLAAPVGTWPSPLPGPLRVSIDNALAGRALSLSNRRVAGPTGSDHRPIAFDVRPAQAPAARAAALRALRERAAGSSTAGSSTTGATGSTSTSTAAGAAWASSSARE